MSELLVRVCWLLAGAKCVRELCMFVTTPQGVPAMQHPFCPDVPHLATKRRRTDFNKSWKLQAADSWSDTPEIKEREDRIN